MVERRYRERAYFARDPITAASQRVAVAKTFGCVRVVYNDTVAARREAYRNGDRFPSDAALMKRLITDAKHTPDRQWLSEVSPVPLQQAVRANGVAYRNFFDSVSGKRQGPKMGLPRFKKKQGAQSARFTRNARFKIRRGNKKTWLVRLPSIPGELRVRSTRPLPDDPSSITLIQEPDGTLHLSFCHDVNESAWQSTHQMPGDGQPGTGVMGADLGLETLTSEVHVDPTAAQTVTDASAGDDSNELPDGLTRRKEPNPRHLRRQTKKLKKQQRRLSRKQKGSNNRRKTKTLVARTHSKVARTRLHEHRQTARRWCHENQVITIEGLAILALCRAGRKGAAGRGFRKSVHDAGWGLLLQQVAYYAELWGREVIPIDRWEPTSQVCCVCGVNSGPKPLHVRVWECPHCGSVVDRDWNAAVNIMVAAGHAETLNAFGGDVRLRLAAADPESPHPVWKEEGTSGNPRGITTLVTRHAC